MFLPLMGIFIFTVLPLLFMIPMAFTNYSVKGDHLVLFDWTGFASFGQVLGLGGKLGKIFWRVLGWTICWAVFATFLCNFLDSFLLSLSIVKRHIARLFGVHALLSQLRYRSSYHSL